MIKRAFADTGAQADLGEAGQGRLQETPARVYPCNAFSREALSRLPHCPNRATIHRMDALLLRFAHRLWPDLDTLNERDRTRLLAELATSLLSLPLVILSLSWLVAATDFSQVRTQWPALLARSSAGIHVQPG